MPKLRLFTIVCLSVLLVFVYACNKVSDEGETAGAVIQEQGEHEGEGQEAGEHVEQLGREREQGEHEGESEQGEHEGERGEHAEGGEGEEAGPRIELSGTFDEVRKGSRLILSFDKESSFFIGTVENVSEKTLSRVRVEVHLSNGTELGPTEPVDLAPGKKAAIKLSTVGQTFEWWKAHTEVGASEH